MRTLHLVNPAARQAAREAACQAARHPARRHSSTTEEAGARQAKPALPHRAARLASAHQCQAQGGPRDGAQPVSVVGGTLRRSQAETPLCWCFFRGQHVLGVPEVPSVQSPREYSGWVIPHNQQLAFVAVWCLRIDSLSLGLSTCVCLHTSAVHTRSQAPQVEHRQGARTTIVANLLWEHVAFASS